MKIAYLQKTSLIDYPGKISAVIFTYGCNLRCPYCHNPELVRPGIVPDVLAEEEVMMFLSKRIGKLDGIVITGGEPCIQKGLANFMHQVKDLGLLIKLDTNGTKPEVLETLIKEGLADYIAMDIKAPIEKYAQVAGAHVDISMIQKSIKLIMDSGIDYEFRTTWVREQLSVEDFFSISSMITGAKRFALQRFNRSKHLDDSMLSASPPAEDDIKTALEGLRDAVKERIIR